MRKPHTHLAVGTGWALDGIGVWGGGFIKRHGELPIQAGARPLSATGAWRRAAAGDDRVYTFEHFWSSAKKTRRSEIRIAPELALGD